MTRNIVWRRPDGSIQIDYLTPSSTGAGLTSAQMADVLRWQGYPDDWEIVAFDAEPPQDRTYRDAWTFANGRMRCDMVKAREIQRDRIRRARQHKLDELDRLWNRARGRKNSKEAAAIEAQRQALRDAPADPAIGRARTPAQLKTIWPDDLK